MGNSNMERIENPTLEQFEAMLNTINWKISGNRLNKFIRNHLDERTNWRVWSDRIEFDSDDKSLCCFYFKHSAIEYVGDEKDTVSIAAIANDSVFVIFMNHRLDHAKDSF